MTESTPKRRLVFAPKTQHQRRDRDTAVAWVVAQQPGQVVDGLNVTATIHKMLKDHGYSVSQSEIRLSMNSLVKEGWAEMLVIGRRTRTFMLKEDVEVPEPVWIKAQARVMTNSVKHEIETKHDLHPANGQHPTQHVMPPIPFIPDPPYRLQELTELLGTWHEKDPEGYTKWVDAVIESLGRLP